MPRIIQSIHLSDYQSRVMLLAHQAETPELAFSELGNQDPRIESNLLGARDTLAKIGLIEISDNAISVTPKGEEVMRDEYLIDETGQITQKGEEILQSEEGEMGPQEKEPGSDPMDSPSGSEMAPVGIGGEMETTPGDSGMPPMEGSIFKLINDLSKLID